MERMEEQRQTNEGKAHKKSGGGILSNFVSAAAAADGRVKARYLSESE